VLTLASPRAGILPVFGFAHFSHHLCTGILIPLLPLMKIAFGLDYFQSGLLVSSFSLAYGFGGPPIAWLADRVSRLHLIAGGLVGVAAAAIAIGLSASYYQLVGLLIVMGLLGASYHAPASSLLSSMFDSSERGRALGIHIVGGSASFLITPVLAGAVAKLLNWNWAFILLSLPALLMALLLIKVAKEPAAAAVKAAGQTRSSISMIEIARILGGVVLLAIMIQVVGSAFSSFLPLFLADVHGVDPAYAGMLAGLAVGTGVLGAPLGGSLSDRLGRKPVILFSLACCGPMIYLISVANFGPMLLFLMGTYGLLMSLRAPTMESLIADVVPFDRRATVLGIYFFLNQETSGVVTPLVGSLIDAVGAGAAFTWLAGVATAMAGAAVLLRRQI